MDSKKLKNLAKVNGIVGLGGGIFLLFATPITVSATLNQSMMVANLAATIWVGIVIEKTFQKGRALLDERDVRVESLARIAAFEDGEVIFAD